MKKIKKGFVLFLAFMILACSFAPTALADSKKKIGKIYLTIDSNV